METDPWLWGRILRLTLLQTPTLVIPSLPDDGVTLDRPPRTFDPVYALAIGSDPR